VPEPLGPETLGREAWEPAALSEPAAPAREWARPAATARDRSVASGRPEAWVSGPGSARAYAASGERADAASPTVRRDRQR
jgi:hypothetical protein